MANDNQMEGKLEQARGTVKDNLGDALGNEQMEREGEMDQAKGQVREGVGDMQDTVDRTADDLRNR